jgi:hypothetical protein
MTFEEILDQAIAMLQRRRRLTCGAIKRHFNLDDAFLKNLTEELIHGQQLAMREYTLDPLPPTTPEAFLPSGDSARLLIVLHGPRPAGRPR